MNMALRRLSENSDRSEDETGRVRLLMETIPGFHPFGVAFSGPNWLPANLSIICGE